MLKQLKLVMQVHKLISIKLRALIFASVFPCGSSEHQHFERHFFARGREACFTEGFPVASILNNCSPWWGEEKAQDKLGVVGGPGRHSLQPTTPGRAGLSLSNAPLHDCKWLQSLIEVVAWHQPIFHT